MTIKQWLADAGLRLLAWLWNREKPKMGASVSIGGVAFTASDIEAAFNEIPAIRQAVKDGKSPADIAKMVAPELLPIIETVANTIFPGAGTGIELFAFIISKSHPMNPAEEEVWFDKAKGDR